MNYKKALYKSTENRIFTGVASGIAEYLDTGHIPIRVIFIILAFTSGIGIVLYISLSILLPNDKEILAQEDENFYYELINKDINKKKSLIKLYFNIIYKSIFNTNTLGLGIVLLGFLALKFNIIPWVLIPETWRYPALILTVGFAFILKSITK